MVTILSKFRSSQLFLRLHQFLRILSLQETWKQKEYLNDIVNHYFHIFSIPRTTIFFSFFLFSDFSLRHDVTNLRNVRKEWLNKKSGEEWRAKFGTVVCKSLSDQRLSYSARGGKGDIRMAKEVSVEAVSEFLKNNPEFLNNWLSSRGLSELADERNRKPTPAHAIGNAFVSYVQSIVQKKRIPQAKLIYNEVNKNDLFKELVRDIADELDVNVLCHKILQNVCILTRSDRGSLFLVRRSPTEQYLVSKLFDVTATSLVDESLHSSREAIHIPFGEGIVGTVAETRKSINIKDAYNDPRFNKDIDMRTGYHTRCIMSLPILGLEEEIVGVACVMNKTDGEYFTLEDEKIFQDYLSFCGIGINNAQLFEIKVEEFKRNQLLLHLVKQITKELGNLKKLVEVILQQALNMLDCQCVSVYILEMNNPVSMQFSRVFELSKAKKEMIECYGDYKYSQLARRCILNGEVVYNPTIYDVGKTLNNADGLLCINIMNSASACIGCIIFEHQSSDVFCRSDLEMMETFALFCGIALQNAQNYEIAFKSEAQKQVALDVLANHSLAPQEEVERLMSFKMLPLENLNIYKFDFNDMIFTHDETVLVCVQLFLEMNVLNKLEISLDLLYQWVLTVRKNYRDVIYHNWRHGLNVAQTMFCMLTTGNMEKHFSGNDCIYLMVASLCHDLDHRGTNNAFQVKVASPLATLYSTSVMEHHHIDRSLMILNSPSTNIFQNLSTDEYKRALKLVEHAILSTDLVVYFEKRNQFKHLVENGEKMFASSEQGDLLLSMMMTACDLSAITKPWNVQRKVALVVAREFYYQGDMEKEMEETVIPLMDRDKRQDLPKMQVSFIDFVCVMVYRYLSEMNELLNPLYQGCLANRENWGNIASGQVKFNVDKRMKKQEISKNFFLEDSSEEEEEEDKQEEPKIEEGTQERDEDGGGRKEDKEEEKDKENVQENEEKMEEKKETEKEENEVKMEEKKEAEKEEKEEKKKQEENEEKKEEEKEEENKGTEEENVQKPDTKEEDLLENDKTKDPTAEKIQQEEEAETTKKVLPQDETETAKEPVEKSTTESNDLDEVKDNLPTTEATAHDSLPELKSRRTYRQPKNFVSERRLSCKPCYDELADDNKKRLEKRRSTIYKDTEEIQPVPVRRRSTVVIPPNPIRQPLLVNEPRASIEAQKIQRLSSFNEYSSSSSWSEGEESSETGTVLRTDSSTQPTRKLTGRISRIEVPSLKQNSMYSAIAEGDDEEEDELPDMQRRLPRRVTGPTKYVARNDRPKRYITK